MVSEYYSNWKCIIFLKHFPISIVSTHCFKVRSSEVMMIMIFKHATLSFPKVQIIARENLFRKESQECIESRNPTRPAPHFQSSSTFSICAFQPWFCWQTITPSTIFCVHVCRPIFLMQLAMLYFLYFLSHLFNQTLYDQLAIYL